MKRYNLAALAAVIITLIGASAGARRTDAQIMPFAAREVAYGVSLACRDLAKPSHVVTVDYRPSARRAESFVPLGHLLRPQEMDTRVALEEQFPPLPPLRRSDKSPEQDSDGDGVPDVVDQWVTNPLRW